MTKHVVDRRSRHVPPSQRLVERARVREHGRHASVYFPKVALHGFQARVPAREETQFIQIYDASTLRVPLADRLVLQRKRTTLLATHWQLVRQHDL